MARRRSRLVTKEDVKFIYENYSKMTAVEIAEKLGISRYQVTKVVSELRKRGVDIPKKAGKRRNPIDEFVEELKKGQ
ncbi:MAG: MarR family transcriptional regulator [Thermodesulfatator sp.]|nr:MAG: MarR family transcriptional regulator [Thermodesulfatator sp.]